MSQPLARGGFRFLDSQEMQKVNILVQPDDGSKGWLLTVDLELNIQRPWENLTMIFHWPLKKHTLQMNSYRLMRNSSG